MALTKEERLKFIDSIGDNRSLYMGEEYKQVLETLKTLSKNDLYKILIDLELNNMYISYRDLEFINVELIRFELIRRGKNTFLLNQKENDYMKFLLKIISLNDSEYLIDIMSNSDLVCDLLKKNINFIRIMDRDMLNNPDVKETLKNFFLNKRITDDIVPFLIYINYSIEEAKLFLENNKSCYIHFPVEYRMDLDLSNIFVQKILPLYASSKAKFFDLISYIENEECLNKLFDENIESLHGITQKYAENKSLMLKIMKKNPKEFAKISKYYSNDYDMAQLVLPYCGEYIKYFNNAINGDPKYAIMAVKSDSKAIKYIGYVSPNREELVIEAIKENPDAANYLSISERKSPKIYALLYKYNPDLVKNITVDTFERETFINAMQSENVSSNNDMKNQLIDECCESFCGSTIISYLVNNFYDQYLKKINNDPDKANKYDFLVDILSDKNILNMLYGSKRVKIQDIRLLETIVRKFPVEKSNAILKIIKEMVEYNSNKNIYIFNLIVKASSDFDKLNSVFKKYKLDETNIYDFIINNRYYDATMKNTLLCIVKNYFGVGLRVIDIMNILEEMDERDLTVVEILNEKSIKKSDFMKLYKESEDSNPILYMYIENKMQRNQLKGFKKILKLGYKVLNSDITSMSEFDEKFEVSAEELLKALLQTDLFGKLADRFSAFQDFDTSILDVLKKK